MKNSIPCCSSINLHGVFLGAFLVLALIGTGFGLGRALRTPNGDSFAQMLPYVLRADTASQGKSVSVATGRVNDDVEAVYILDHVTQNLVCYVLDFRNRQQPLATFTASLQPIFGQAKQGDLDLTLVSGYINANEGGRTGQMRTGESFCYVLEGNTGTIAAYGFQFSQTGFQNSNPQRGELVPIWQGLFRDPALNPKPAAGKNGNDKDQDKAKAPNVDEKKK